MVAELADLRDTLLVVAREKLSTRQVLMISSSSPVEESLLVDPSIRNNYQQEYFVCITELLQILWS